MTPASGILPARHEGSDLFQALLCEVVRNAHIVAENNFDHDRYGYPSDQQSMPISTAFRRDPAQYGEMHSQYNHEILKELISAAETLYPLLEDDHSRDLLVKLLAYRVLGCEKMVLPLNTPFYREQRIRIHQLANRSDFIAVNFLDWKLFRYDLAEFGYPIQAYLVPLVVHNTFVVEQYSYRTVAPPITVTPGDTVIDCGGCFGDTALYFAHKCGDSGKVYSFEFIPSQIEIFNRNLDLNPQLQPKIEIIPQAVWSESGNSLNIVDCGPASRITLEPTGLQVSTCTIDDLVRSRNISSVDFIKMDIEGSEIPALSGAVETIRRFKPKLAISAYHGIYDFDTIPRLIASLDLGYKFYLGHYTIYTDETVIFCLPESRMI